MGYRTYIAEMPKREYNKIKSLTKSQLFNFYKDSKELESESDFHISVYEFGNPLFEFGKYTEFQPPKKSMKKFFKKKELMNDYEEYDFFIVSKEFIQYIIETYKTRIQNYYNAMILPFVTGEHNDKGDFLRSVKTHYGMDESYEFDFSKITEEQQTALYKIIEHVRSFRTEWIDLTPYDLPTGNEVTTSWKFEYAIFELVRIYKSFDWKKNVMIYYGY